MLQPSPVLKSKRLVALCPPDLHEAFLCLADRTGESAGVILRSLVAEAVERAKRGEPLMLKLQPEATR